MAIDEVHTLLKLVEKPSMHCFFTVVYSMGLRLQEALHLQIADIDSKRWLVHIYRGKGAKDAKFVGKTELFQFEHRSLKS